jgi:hypothetical protein
MKRKKDPGEVSSLFIFPSFLPCHLGGGVCSVIPGELTLLQALSLSAFYVAYWKNASFLLA